MLEVKKVEEHKNWKEASKDLVDDDRFSSAPEESRREWYIAYLKSLELEGILPLPPGP